MSEIEFKIILRAPIYPLIIVSTDRLYSAFNINQLAENCLNSIPSKETDIIKAIDSTGEEFWYSYSAYVISPGFSFKKWTKKRIIEMYNESPRIKGTELEYSLKSLSSKKVAKIILDISEQLQYKS